MGQWLLAPWNGGTCKRAATLEPTKRRRELTHNTPGWHPEEKATKLPKEGKLWKQRGCHQCTKGRGPKDPTAQEVKGVAAQLASTWFCGNYWDASRSCWSCLCAQAPQLSSLRQWHAYWVVFPSSRHTLVSFLSSQTRMPPNSSLTTRQFQRYGVMCGWVRHCACLFGLKGIRCVADPLCVGAAELSESSCTNSSVKLTSTAWWSRYNKCFDH